MDRFLLWSGPFSPKSDVFLNPKPNRTVSFSVGVQNRFDGKKIRIEIAFSPFEFKSLKEKKIVFIKLQFIFYSETAIIIMYKRKMRPLYICFNS